MALAPEQAGIGIRRHFTTPGVHPYDELEWDRRDARITNFRDGSVAVLCATDLAARGLDVDGVTHVVNYDLPNIP